MHVHLSNIEYDMSHDSSCLGSAATDQLELGNKQAISMGCRALASNQAAVRARSFDIVYNLAVHAELLSNSEAANVAELIEVSPWQSAVLPSQISADRVCQYLAS